ncbi:MAG: nicotinate phosphoribosyltransferase [Dehalococcoidia bacterium]|nr:nicotinate phosphoribosyltransferase [Dehalococcoidia bacterium]
MPEPDFEVRPSVMVGDSADVSFHRGTTILRNEGINPVVVMEFSPTEGGVFCGIKEVKALLGKVLPESNREVWALEEGTKVSPGEVALRITAPYGSFGLYETALCGTLSHSTGWATASKECVVAAAGIPVISTGARYVHPGVAGIMDYAAMIGGCVSCSTSLGAKLAGTTPTGTISPNIALIMGDTVRAMQAFDRHIPQEVSRVAPVNIMKDETEESIGLAKALRQRLRGVILDESQTQDGIHPHTVKEVRARMDLAGYSHVEIFVRGELNGERIREFIEEGAPVSVFEVGRYISSAVPYEFNADIREIDGKPIARRGRIPGSTPNPRLVEVM